MQRKSPENGAFFFAVENQPQKIDFRKKKPQFFAFSINIIQFIGQKKRFKTDKRRGKRPPPPYNFFYKTLCIKQFGIKWGDVF